MPQGATPRSLVIHLRGPLTRTCKPGDSVTVAGIFLPQPYTGFRAMRAGLLTTTYLEAMSVTQDKRSYKDTAADDSLRVQIEVGLSGCTLTYSCASHVVSRLILLICKSPHMHARPHGSHVTGETQSGGGLLSPQPASLTCQFTILISFTDRRAIAKAAHMKDLY